MVVIGLFVFTRLKCIIFLYPNKTHLLFVLCQHKVLYCTCKDGVVVKISYDNSTKEKELSYRVFIKESLEKLGFRKNTIGTKYLIELILFAFMKDYFNIFINRISIDFLKCMGIDDISLKQFLDNINYAIKNVDIDKFKSNFYLVFHNDYDVYYFSTKNIVVLFLGVLEEVRK